MVKDFKVTLNEPISDDRKWDQRDKRLKQACQEFESVFKFELLKSMRRTVEKCDLFGGGYGEQVYESLLDQELAKRTSGNAGNSLASLLYNQFNRDRSPGTATGEIIHGGADFTNSLPRWPVKGRISSKFGLRKDPIDGQTRFHRGVDPAAAEGTFVRASLPGRVRASDYQKGYGNLVVLDHGQGITTHYAHNQANLVKEGEWVRGGFPIARVGSSGRSTGAHLHFEVRKHDRQLDPLGFFGSDAGPLLAKPAMALQRYRP